METDPTPEQVAFAKSILDAENEAQKRARHESVRQEQLRRDAAKEAFRVEVHKLWPLEWESEYVRESAYVTIQVIPGVWMTIEQPEPDCTGFPCSIFTSGDYPCKFTATSLHDAVYTLRAKLQVLAARFVLIAEKQPAV